MSDMWDQIEFGDSSPLKKFVLFSRKPLLISNNWPVLLQRCNKEATLSHKYR